MPKIGVDITQREYYQNNGVNPKNENWGSYQYMLLTDIVNNFMLTYVGDDKVINKVDRNDVVFHAKRGLQEIHYDALREIRGFEVEVPETLKMHLPHDFVSLVKVSYVGSDGKLHPIMPDHDFTTPISYLQDNTVDANLLIDSNGNAVTGTPVIETNWKARGGNLNTPDRYSLGKRFGMNTSTANHNGAYHIDKDQGLIMFSSALSMVNIVIEYVSDGVYGLSDSEIKIHKLAETFMYDYINAQILRGKFNVQEYIVRRVDKRLKASRANMKIRLNSIKLHELTQILRGRDKWIK
jgi:hypothetical protein